MKTRIAYLEGPGKVIMAERDPIIKDDEVLIKTYQSSICGTDKNLYRGFLPPGYSYPVEYFGHEGGGVVVEVGPKVRTYKIGDQVISCGKNRTFSDYFKAKEETLHHVPQGLQMDIASLGEPLGCIMYSIFHSGVEIGDVVAVVGLGFAGQVMVQGAKRKGAKTVVGIDFLEGKLRLARELGADVTVNIETEDPIKVVRDLSEGKGADVVFEAAGTEASMNLSTELLRRNGILALYSWVMEPVKLNISRWHDEAMDIRTTCMMHLNPPYERYVWLNRVLNPLKDEKTIKIRPLLSKQFTLEQISEAFDYACNNKEAIKVIIKP